jgi:ATP-binding cassette, subfamily B, bacterial
MKAASIITYFWHHAWQFKGLTISVLIIVPLAMFVHTFLASLIVAGILDRLTRGDYAPNDFLGSFGGSIALYIVTYLLGNVVLYRLVTFFSWQLDMHVVRSIKQQVFNHLVSLDANFHANHLGGALVAQATKLASAYERVSQVTLNSFLPVISVITFTTIVLLPRVPVYLFVLFPMAICYLSIAILSAKKIRRFNTAYAKATSAQAGLVADSITNILTVKSFARDSYEQARFKTATNRTFQASKHLLSATLRRDTHFSLVGSCFSIGAVIMVIVSIMYLNVSIGTAFLMLTYSLAIAQKIWEFSANGLRQYNQAFGDAQDMLETLQTQPAVRNSTKKISVVSGKKGVTFQAVNFTHADAADALFRDFSLTIKPGEKVGLVGRSGAGKSTLTRLLLRFTEVDDGKILLGKQNITSISQEELRAHIAYVPQEPLLFHRSIKENIGYGKPGASDEAIQTAAKQAHALEFIEKLPQKFDTLVGERGVKLSGGQRQRIAIARAILKDSPILILDEATAALDSESEKLIQASLDSLMKGRTSIVIAHRLSTIAKLDRIIVLEEGKIVEDGTHQTLLKKKGVYASLWKHQSGGFIEE